MRIGIAQLNTQAGNFAATTERMEAIARSARAQGVELLLFPLVALTGPHPVDYASQEGFLLDLTDALVGLSDSLGVPAVVPVITEVDGVPFAEAMLLRSGEAAPLRLLDYAAHAKGPAAAAPIGRAAAARNTAFELDGYRFGVAFTYEDLNAFEDEQEDIDALLFFSSYGYALDDPDTAMGASLAENRYSTDALMLDAWLVGVASLGGYSSQVYAGASFVLDATGGLVASAAAFEETLLVCDMLSLDAPEPDDLEPEIYNRSLHLWESLSLGLHDFVSKQGGTDVALVLDGSLASSLLAVLASDALGPRHVHALVEGEGPEGRVARSLAEVLRLDYEVLWAPDLRYQSGFVLEADFATAQLAAFARARHALPLSCADKTHLALEATTAEDRCFALLPFGDVYRSDLIELAHMRNTISPVIPLASFQSYAVPSIEGLAEVEPTPEARLRRVDVTLSSHVEWERSLTDVVARQGEEALTGAILRQMRACEPARRMMGPVLAMSARTLADARMPLGFGWADRMRGEDERAKGTAALGGLVGTGSSGETDAERVAIARGMLGDLSGDFLNNMELPEGVDRREVESSIGELLGFVQDLLQGDASAFNAGEGGNPPLDGPFGPLTWGSPFSDN